MEAIFIHAKEHWTWTLLLEKVVLLRVSGSLLQQEQSKELDGDTLLAQLSRWNAMCIQVLP